jgi:hypothetical protein
MKSSIANVPIITTLTVAIHESVSRIACFMTS